MSYGYSCQFLRVPLASAPLPTDESVPFKLLQDPPGTSSLADFILVPVGCGVSEGRGLKVVVIFRTVTIISEKSKEAVELEVSLL